MKVSEVEKMFRPLCEQALEKSLTLAQCHKALETVLVMVALEKHGKNQNVVAHFLGTHPPTISRIVRGGKVPQRRRSTNFERHHGGSPQQVLGDVAL